METALSSCANTGIDIASDMMSDLEYVDNVVLLSEDSGNLVSFLHRLSDGIECLVYVLHLLSVKCCCMTGLNWLKAYFAPSVVEWDKVDRFGCLGSYIPPGSRTLDERSARIRKARIASNHLRHLWLRRGIRLSIKGQVYATALRSVLLYASET